MFGYVVMSLNGSVILAQSLYRTEKKKKRAGLLCMSVDWRVDELTCR